MDYNNISIVNGFKSQSFYSCLEELENEDIVFGSVKDAIPCSPKKATTSGKEEIPLHDITDKVSEVSELSFFDPERQEMGRALAVDTEQEAWQTPKLKKVKHLTIEHDNAIFGSYALEDVKAISSLVLAHDPKSMVKYDCFNYETVSELTSNPDIKKIYERNVEWLHRKQKGKKLAYEIHYKDKKNDLMARKEDDWGQHGRIYKKNMVFFNPYLINKKNTEKLIEKFFSYAGRKLEDNGVVTMMWNPDREDGIQVDIKKIATKHGFFKMKCISGQKFAESTRFVHLKNSTSLGKAGEEAKSVKVSSKKTDCLYMFRKKQELETALVKDNEMALAFLSLEDEETNPC